MAGLQTFKFDFLYFSNEAVLFFGSGNPWTPMINASKSVIFLRLSSK